MNKIESLMKWIRSHDWGRDAWIKDGIVYGLLDVTTDSVTIVSMPADKQILARWAGY